MSGFLWGVATASYQIEGGINGPGEPANNWAEWDRAGKVEPCGDALGFWREPDQLLDLTKGLGCNAFRLSIEWARVQPSEHEWDDAALERYAQIVADARSRGLEPVVTLHHFTHPLWCGIDFWLRPDSPELLATYARRCVRALGPIRWWITLNEPAVVPFAGYILGRHPTIARGAKAGGTAYDNMLAAHIRAYDAIHDVHEEQGWEPPIVSTNTYSATPPDLDAIVVELLVARERGVGRGSLPAHLAAARRRARARAAAVPRLSPVATIADAAVDRLVRLAGVRPDGRAVHELYASPRPRKLDAVTLDLYDAVIGNWLRGPWGKARALRGLPIAAELWEQAATPAGLAVFLRQAHLLAPGRPILVAENGMCTPGMRPRPDGESRVRFLKGMCAEVVRARGEGLPIAGYLHWTLADNYEWGSYKPRFGLYGADRTNGVRILPTDAVGEDAAGAYREIIASDMSRPDRRGSRGGSASSGASAL